MSKVLSMTASSETPVPPEIGERAAQISALLDQIEALIPNYTKLDSGRARTVRGNARFAHELIAPTITAVTNYEPLHRCNLFDVERGRNALQFRDELRPIEQRMAVVTSALAFTIDSHLAEAAIEALQTYRWSQYHVRHPEGEGLRPYVEEMERVVKKGLGRRAKAKTTPGSPAPQATAGAHAQTDEKVTV